MKIEKKKLSEILAPMTFSEKVKYLWHYYRIHLFATIAVLFLVGSLISTMLNKQEVVLNVVIMGSMVNTDNLSLLDDELTKELLSKEEADSTDVSVRFINFSSDSMSPDTAMGVQKMAAELSAKSIDVFIINKDLFTDMSSDGQLLSLEELEGFDKNVFAEEQLYTSGEGKINGISTLNLKMFDEIIYNEEELIIAVPMNFQNKDKTSEFFKLVK